ncbi:MAG TPA: hypothetical protein VFY06_14645, partial [Verrucomicrobiae bacterium]|nr:hypothetical protein [Verrucomicrobiae bacterium]
MKTGRFNGRKILSSLGWLIGIGHFAKGGGEPTLFLQIRQFSAALRLLKKRIYRRVRKFSLLQ